MLADVEAFSGLGCEDIERAREFYEQTLGLRTTVLDAENGLVELNLAGGRDTLLYKSPGFRPASNTVLNFKVDDIDVAVDEMARRGVAFERYDEFPQDEKGVMREGERFP